MTEHRSSPRLALRRPAGYPLCTATGRQVGVAVVEDVSTDGLQLLVRNRHAVGETLTVDVERRPHVGPLRLEFVVAWCLAVTGGGFHLGGRLLSPLAEEKALALAGSD